MIAVPTKADVLRDLDSAWGDLMQTIEAILDDDCETPGVVDEWTLKDLLGHMAFWSGQAASTLRCATAGRLEDVDRGHGDNWVDEWNKREYEARKDHSLSQVRAEWMRNHRDAAEALDHAPPEVLDMPFNNGPIHQYFAGDTYEHYREHTEHIKAWQQQLDTSEA